MSVLINSMKMPESCQMCYLFNFKNSRISAFDHDTQYMKAWSCWNACAFSGDRMVNDIRERPEWCPLIEIPPHGRLIDADALTKCLADLLRFPSNLVNGQWIVNTIREQPTVIEAEDDSE